MKEMENSEELFAATGSIAQAVINLINHFICWQQARRKMKITPTMLSS